MGRRGTPPDAEPVPIILVDAPEEDPAPTGPRRAPKAVQTVARTVDRSARAIASASGRTFGGDRPLVVGLLAILVTGLVLVSGPFQSYAAQRDRVENLERQSAALADEVARLEALSEDLRSDAFIEQRAREQFDMVFPGEQAFKVIPPDAEVELDASAPELGTESTPWYARAWSWMTGWMRSDEPAP